MPNKIIIISGPSGVGKGTIIQKLLKDKSLNLLWAKSYTTRKPRLTDKAEHHYIFINKEKFAELQRREEIFEITEHNANKYGSSRSEIENALKQNKNVLKDIDTEGLEDYKKIFPEVVAIFIFAPIEQIKKQLEDRGVNTKKEISERLETAKKELKYKNKYDYAVKNVVGKPEIAIKKIKQIITNTHKLGSSFA